METRPADALVDHYDRRLIECGDTAQGAFWPNEADRLTRFDVMLDVIQGDAGRRVVLCDLGCGTGELLAHIRNRGLNAIDYIGADRSRIALAHARAKFPGEKFIALDVNAPGANLDEIACDYLVADGVFTAKFDLSHDEMQKFLTSTIERVWPKVRRGIAFNVMSKVVDWERDDLFHLPMDDAARLLHRLAGRRVRFRADYGLYEYTAYAFKPQGAVTAPAVKAVEGNVPVLRPLLPTRERLAPYLAAIDASRVYSNFAPLSRTLESRLAAHLALPSGGLACGSSGAGALIGAILATAGVATKRRPLALMPALTFVATAHAAERCGYQCSLADIDPQTWMLDPERLLGHPALEQVGVVIPVAPFGRPVPQAPWQAFQDRSGIRVVIDGAASFDRIEAAPRNYLGAIPVMLSFHATKSFGVGEGGCIACTDIALMERIVQALNYGFHGARNAETAAINGKMSEYHAAVGLAELDGWSDKRAAFEKVIGCYRRKLGEAGLAHSFVGAPDIGLSYALFQCADSAAAQRAQAAMQRARIGARLWYGLGLHRQSWFAQAPREALVVADALAPRLIGLPLAPDLTPEQIDRVVAALVEGLAAPA